MTMKVEYDGKIYEGTRAQITASLKREGLGQALVNKLVRYNVVQTLPKDYGVLPQIAQEQEEKARKERDRKNVVNYAFIDKRGNVTIVNTKDRIPRYVLTSRLGIRRLVKRDINNGRTHVQSQRDGNIEVVKIIPASTFSDFRKIHEVTGMIIYFDVYVDFTYEKTKNADPVIELPKRFKNKGIIDGYVEERIEKDPYYVSRPTKIIYSGRPTKASVQAAIVKHINKLNKEKYYGKDALIRGYSLLYVSDEYPIKSQEDNRYHSVDTKTGLMGNSEVQFHDDKWYRLAGFAYNLNMWKNLIQEESYSNCVVDIVAIKYPKLQPVIERLVDGEGYITNGDFMDFCKSNKVGYRLYGVNGKILSEGGKKTNRITGMVFNNHVYPLTEGSDEPIKAKHKVNERVFTDTYEELVKILVKYVKKYKTIPSNIAVRINPTPKPQENPVILKCFTVDNVKYIYNEEYEKCKEIIKKSTGEDHTKDDMTIMSLPNEILKLKNLGVKQNLESFIPHKMLYKAKAILYQKDHPQYTSKCNLEELFGELTGIDKNKAYAYSLKNLSFLIVHDWRKHNVYEYSGQPIIRSFLYVVQRADYWSLLIPQSGLYPGSHLIYCQTHGVDFTILEVLEAEERENIYRPLIEEMYSYMEECDFKVAYTRFIGNMERNMSVDIVEEFDSITLEQDTKYYEGTILELSDDINIKIVRKKKYSNVMDKLPISIQVKCGMYTIIQDKLNELKVNPDDVVQISTDSIIFKKKKIPKGHIGTGIDDWKMCKIGETKDYDYMKDNKIIGTLKFTGGKPQLVRELYHQYAGSGKTYKVLNIILPKYAKKDIIILTPTREACADYIDEMKKREKQGLKTYEVQVIQNYTFKREVPTQKFVIIDEFGMCDQDAHNLLYVLHTAGYEYICLGDFNQLEAISKYKNDTLLFNREHYFKLIFNKIYDDEFVNERNDFTKEYYDKLITSESKNFLIKELTKYSTKHYYNAEKILCFTKATRDKYNTLMLKKLGLKKNAKGTKVVCESNKLLQDGIWNGREMIIDDITRTKLKAKNKTINVVEYTLKDKYGSITVKGKHMKLFKHSYCVNIHRAQGKSFKSIYWAQEDNKHVTNRVAYVAISRIKTKNLEN